MFLISYFLYWWFVLFYAQKDLPLPRIRWAFSTKCLISLWNYHSDSGVVNLGITTMNHLTCHLFGELLTISIFRVFSLGGLSLPWEDSSRVLPEETELGSQISQMREEHWRAQLPKYIYPSNCPIFSSVPWCLRSPWFHPGPWDFLFLFSRE